MTTTSQSSLVGTWNYAKPCVQFESESLLAKAGGSMMSNKVESTLVQGASSQLSSQNSTIATISKLAGNFNGMKLGFEFTR